MKLVSWNVNGIRSILKKTKDGEKHKNAIEHNSLRMLMREQAPDVVCLQEVRMKDALELLRAEFGTEYPYIYVNVGKKAGYSGTAVLSKLEPLRVDYDFDASEELNGEGRVIRADFGSFVLVNVYSPNSQAELKRLPYRTEQWEPMLQKLLASYETVILTGDLNVAHTKMDIWTEHGHEKSAGYTEQERIAFGLHLHNLNLVDTFRKLHPNDKKYTYWSNFSKSRHHGWRIDYFVTSKRLLPKVQESDMLSAYRGSDHVPIYLVLA